MFLRRRHRGLGNTHTMAMGDSNHEETFEGVTQSASPQNPKPSPTSWLKWVSLICLVTQNASVVLVMRKTRSQSTDLFISSTAVIMQEVLKCVACLCLVLYQSGSVSHFLHTLHTQIILQPWDTLKVAVPSFIYVIQNNLLYVGITHLSAATFQITYQAKILTTAIFSVLMLKRSLSKIQWLALAILFAGVCIVQVEQQYGGGSAEKSAVEQKPLVGLLAVLVACVMSGFSGVYFEKILKGSEVSIWVRNIQLSAISLPIAWLTLEIQDGARVHELGFFHGYHQLVWLAICIHGFGGLLVAVVVKYADNILKGFATSLAIIISCIGAVYFFNFHLTAQFALGALLVLGAMFLYSQPPFIMTRLQIGPVRKV